MRWIRSFLLVVSLVVIQTALFPSLRVWGAVPDLLLVATVAVAYERGAETGAVFGFVAGVAIDLFLSSPLGVSALTFAAFKLSESATARDREARGASPAGRNGEQSGGAR